MPTGESAFDCLGVVARECGLTQKMADDVIEGFALDAADWHPRRESDLYRYCYHVAGAVGVMMAVVMGVSADDDATLDRACDLGLAFQLANIARDIAEDDAAGRCYLPDDWLATLDIGPGEHMKPHNRKKLALMGRWLADEAEQYEASRKCRRGCPALARTLGGVVSRRDLWRNCPQGPRRGRAMPGTNGFIPAVRRNFAGCARRLSMLLPTTRATWIARLCGRGPRRLVSTHPHILTLALFQELSRVRSKEKTAETLRHDGIMWVRNTRISTPRNPPRRVRAC